MNSGPFRIVFLSKADADLSEVLLWYEEQELGLGQEFLRAFRASIAVLQRTPLIYREVEKDVQRTMLRRFPYAIYYTVRGNDVVIIGCFHISRDPRQWRNRMSEL